jgi:hypothetical protein
MKEFLAFLIGLPGTAAVTTGGVIIFLEIVHYLQVGYWTPVTVLRALQEVGLSPPVTSWVGVQKMVDGVLGLPFGVVSVLAGIAFFWIAFRIIDKIS